MLSIPHFITSQMSDMLTSKFSKAEFRKGCFQMGAFKDPRPDEYTANFFQSHWKVVKVDVMKTPLSFQE